MKFLLMRLSIWATRVMWIGQVIYWAATGFRVDAEWFIFMAVFAIPTLYLILLRCSNCGNLIYTGAHIAKGRAYGYRFPTYTFRNCPECNATLNSDESLTIKGWPIGGFAGSSSASWVIVVGIGCFAFAVTTATSMAHYLFGVPIDFGTEPPSALAALLIGSFIFSVITIAVGIVLKRRSSTRQT